MKKNAIFILVMSLVIPLLTSCGKTEGIDNDNDYITFTADDYDMIYEVSDELLYFTIDDDGTLYYSTVKVEYSENNTPISAICKLIAVDLNGDILQEIEISEFYSYDAFDVKNGMLYYNTSYASGDGKQKIFMMDMSNGEVKELCTLDDYVSIKNIAIIDNILYFSGVNKAATIRDYKIYQLSDNFFYYGDIVSSFNLETGERKDIFNDLAINFSKTTDGNLMIYAYDENGGYYFQIYDTKTNSFGDKIYRTINYLRDSMTRFMTLHQDKQIIIRNGNEISVSELESGNFTEILRDANLTKNDFIYKSGYLFYLDEEKNIKRILLSKFFRSPVTLNMGFMENYAEAPDNYGYFINRKNLNRDEFALSVLSGDNDIDFYLISSSYEFSDNIKNKGAYYRLNDVPGVMEYLEASFPYLKEAAINTKNDVWMIPVKADSPAVFYNPKVWERYNLDIKSIKTINEFIDLFYYFNDNDIDEGYYLDAYAIIRKYFYQLIEKCNGFNREEFKKMAEYSYDKLNYIKNPIKKTYTVNGVIDYGILVNETTKTDTDSCIAGLFNAFKFDGISITETSGFTVFDNPPNYFFTDFYLKSEDYYNYDEAKKDKNRTYFSIHNYVNLRRTSLPNIEGMDKNDITCEFFYVNPNSENLDLVLEYISEYCKETMNKRNTFILKDKSTYDDRVYINDFYDIYNSDSYVRFGLSEELFFEDFVKYLGDEITLDEYLNRVEYKINAYLNE